MDVVIYERFLCPVFCINDNPETTYYPCEGVMAVGEIKSTVGKAEFDDSDQGKWNLRKTVEARNLHVTYPELMNENAGIRLVRRESTVKWQLDGLTFGLEKLTDARELT